MLAEKIGAIIGANSVSPNKGRTLAFIAAATASLILAGCSPVSVKPQARDGYNAIRFRSTIQVRDHAINIYTFTANSVFIEDRQSDFGPLYCGQATINDAITNFNICIGVRDESTIVIGPGAGFKEVDRDVGASTFTRFKLKI